MNADAATVEFYKPPAPTRSIAPAIAQSSSAPAGQPQAGTSSAPYYATAISHYQSTPVYSPRTAVYQYGANNWTYQYPMPTSHTVPYGAPGSSTQNYAYPRAYYPPGPAYQPYAGYGYPHVPPQQLAKGLQWQRPYTGPRNTGTDSPSSAQVPPYPPIYNPDLAQPESTPTQSTWADRPPDPSPAAPLAQDAPISTVNS